jgi:arylsulfatase A-like enzyme
MNVICICLDTFRNDIVGPGKKLSHTRTPYLDDFYARSVAFEGAYGEGQPTLQMRRGFFTGCRSFPFDYNFDRRGHWHHQGMVADAYHMFKPTMNYTRGMVAYDFVRGQESDNWKPARAGMVEEQLKRHVREPINWGRHAMLTQYLANQGVREGEDDYQCARVFGSACEWLDAAHENAPFFLWVDSFDPHEPWDPPTKYADEYCPDYDGLDFIVPGAMHQDPGATEAEIERTRALYLGEVTFVDKQVGRLFDKLDELNLWDETIVVVLSDHGTEIMDHGTFGKGGGNMRTYNAGFLWYMWHPDGPHGVVSDALVQSHDLMPTLLGQLDVPHRCEGLDVWGLATGATDSVRDHIVNGWALHSIGSAQAAASVMDGEWLYSCGVGGAEVEEMLFALPDEDTNLVADHPDLVALSRKRIEAVMNQPLPGRFNEACDQGPMPFTSWLDAKRLAEGPSR